MSLWCFVDNDQHGEDEEEIISSINTQHRRATPEARYAQFPQKHHVRTPFWMPVTSRWIFGVILVTVCDLNVEKIVYRYLKLVNIVGWFYRYTPRNLLSQPIFLFMWLLQWSLKTFTHINIRIIQKSSSFYQNSYEINKCWNSRCGSCACRATLSAGD